jgi:hypothetical protein
MSDHPQPRRCRRPRRKEGFRPVSRTWYALLGVPREKRREFYNMLSRWVVVAFAVTGGAVGTVEWGWLGGAVLALLGTGFGVWFVREQRMFR